MTHDSAEEDDTPLPMRADQFATYYLLAVLAVRALEEARRHAGAAKEQA